VPRPSSHGHSIAAGKGSTTVAQSIANLHNVNMDKESSLSLLQRLLASRALTQTAIGKALGIHPSQVSRICAGQFQRMTGNALRVCKYANQVEAKLLAARARSGVVNDLEGKLAQLLMVSPEAALAVGGLIDALLDASYGGGSTPAHSSRVAQ
jgi:predicted XRE-type DNA-binding protein